MHATRQAGLIYDPMNTTPLHKIVELRGLTLPAEATLKRKHVRPPERHTDHYLEHYDRQTLIYDCFYQPDKKRYIITAPRFLNLWFLMTKHLYANGQRFRGRLKRSTWQRCEQVEFYAPENAQLEIKTAEFTAPIEVRSTIQADFAGLNVALAINKDNPLNWIRDWAQFHVNAQKLEGICLIDNASTKYTPQDILHELSQVKGLKAITVLVAPFPYGPVNRSLKLEISPRFLQTAMFNVVKRDLFNKARAILSVDIDELVVSNSPTTIFDAAVQSRLGAISFREIKTYPNTQIEAAFPQRDHVMVKKQLNFGNTKWCVSGQGFMNRFGWAVHRFGGAFFLLTESKAFNYLHCQATSTSWKKYRLTVQPDLVASKDISNVIHRHLA